MIIEDKQHAVEDHIIHLTEDNMSALKLEISSVRGALCAKFPKCKFQHILPNLDPDCVIPEDPLFEVVLGPDPESKTKGAAECGWTLRADRIPYSIFLAKFVGTQVDVETPFIEELLLWVAREEGTGCS